jgi:hypothetical protein
MENDPNPHPEPIDPMLGPRVEFNPEEFGYLPDMIPEDHAVIEAARGDFTLFMLQETIRALERLQGTPAAYPDIGQRLQSFRDRAMLREHFLDGES